MFRISDHLSNPKISLSQRKAGGAAVLAAVRAAKLARSKRACGESERPRVPLRGRDFVLGVSGLTACQPGDR